MTKFETSEHANLLSELDNHNKQNIEYWSKGENNDNLPHSNTTSL